MAFAGDYYDEASSWRRPGPHHWQASDPDAMDEDEDSGDLSFPGSGSEETDSEPEPCPLRLASDKTVTGTAHQTRGQNHCHVTAVHASRDLDSPIRDGADSDLKHGHNASVIAEKAPTRKLPQAQADSVLGASA